MSNIQPIEHYKNLSIESIEGEIWKDIIGFEGLYQISSLGRVKSLKSTHRTPRELIRAQGHDKDGYCRLVLYGTRVFYTKIHSLVADHFIPKIEGKNCINHINAIKWDNRVENLERCTNKENVDHYIKLGLKVITRGSDHELSKLTDNQAIEIYNSPDIITDIANRYSVSTQTVINIKNKKSWTHLTKQLSDAVVNMRKNTPECHGITRNQIIEIFKDKRMQKDIAIAYGISKSRVCGIKNKRSWIQITSGL